MVLEITALEAEITVAKACIAARKQVGMLTEQESSVFLRLVVLRDPLSCRTANMRWKYLLADWYGRT
jgi:hypothetical protein